MALPMVPILGALGALGLFFLTRGDTSSSSKPGDPKGGSSTPGPMPAALQAAVAQLLANSNVSPDDLDRFATELEKYGYTAEAAQLRARASQLRTSPTPVGPTPFPPIPVPIPPAPIPDVPPIPNLEDILPPMPSPTPNTFLPNGITTAPSGVWLRDKPHESGSQITLLLPGTPVQIVGRLSTPTPASPEGWTELLTVTGTKGYAASKWVQSGGVPSPTPQPTPSLAQAIVATQSTALNVRAAPNESSGIVGTAAKGSRVTVLETGLPATAAAPSGWSKIQTDSGVTGYASSAYLSPAMSTSGLFGWDIG